MTGSAVASEARAWSGVADAYARTGAPLCAGALPALLEATGVTADEADRMRVLDVGAGTGELGARAAELGALVTAVDPIDQMLAIAARAAPSARLVQAALPDLPFADGCFDAVLANFVVNHVADPRASLRELARVVARGGRVGVTIWPSGQTQQARLWADVLEESGVVPPPAARLPPERDFSRTLAGLADLLTGAGLVEVRVRAVRWIHRADRDALWDGAAAGVGGIGVTVTSQPPRVREAMKAAYDRRVVSLLEDGRLVLHTEALLAVGTRIDD